MTYGKSFKRITKHNAMVRYYELLWSNVLDEVVMGEHMFELPVFVCPECESDYGVSICFPWIDGKQVFDAKTLGLMAPGKQTRNYGLEQYRIHSAALQKVVGTEHLVAPGVSFGVFRGKIRSKPSDFQYQIHHADDLFVKESVVGQLNKHGFNLRTFPVELKNNDGVEKLVEIWAPAVGLAANMRICEKCKRSPDKISRVLKTETIPNDVHFFRLQNWPNYLVMSGELVDKIRELEFTGLSFDELKAE